MCCGPNCQGVAVTDSKGLHRHRGCPAGGAGREIRQGGVGCGGGRQRQRPGAESVTTLNESDPLRKATIAGQSRREHRHGAGGA